jgi:O-antigen ligase
VGVAFLAIVFAGRRDAGFSWPSRATLLVLFGACLYLAKARTVFAGLALAGLFGWWLLSKRSSFIRRLAGALAIGLAMFLLVTSFAGPVTRYIYRGQSQQQVYSLDGRLGLWSLAVHELDSPGRWLAGYGLGGTRVLFATSTTWAADAHSAWLELLLSLGLLGAVAGAAMVATVGARLLRAARDGPLPSNLLLILFVYVLAMSPVGTGFAAPGPEPGLGFALLAFCYAATAAREPVVSRVPVRKKARLEHELRPAPI